MDSSDFCYEMTLLECHEFPARSNIHILLKSNASINAQGTTKDVKDGNNARHEILGHDSMQS